MAGQRSVSAHGAQSKPSRCRISPGGVGQSLYTMHLDRMLGANHGYFDPGIWYQEDELRKVARRSAAAHTRGCPVALRQSTGFGFLGDTPGMGLVPSGSHEQSSTCRADRAA